MLERIEGSVALRRAWRRAGRGDPRRPVAPARPVGAKLELTHRCNLRCGFCYTDSPRHTLARTPDLPDDAWRRIVEEAIDLGIVEAVLIGGEPLLRRELCLELLERLDGAGVGAVVTTNGWFLDAEFADRVAALRGVLVNVSIDGATPAVHDAARGAPGSWRRAVEAAHLLLERDVAVEVIHVVTPDNADGVTRFLDHMWLLGVPRVLLVPVAQIGAAARSGRWRINRRRMLAAAQTFQRRHRDMRVTAEPLPGGGLVDQSRRAPASLLVHASGAVAVDSLHPFAFGNAARDGVEECWRRIAAGWNDPRIDRWARGIGNLTEIHDTGLVAYRDESVDPRGWPPHGDAGRDPPPLPAPISPGVDDADPDAARARVRELALSRRYRLAPIRVAELADGTRYVRLRESGRVVRLNRTASTVMDACDGASAAHAVARLRARHPDLPRETAERDALAAVRLLRRRGVLRPGPSA